MYIYTHTHTHIYKFNVYCKCNTLEYLYAHLCVYLYCA